VHDASGTWHHGLIARWWAEFTAPQPHEVDYYAAAIRRYGEPALDLGCGNGRILMPLLELDPEQTLPNGTRLDDALEALAEGQRAERVGAFPG